MERPGPGTRVYVADTHPTSLTRKLPRSKLKEQLPLSDSMVLSAAVLWHTVGIHLK